MGASVLKLRLLRQGDAPPTNPHGYGFAFRLQYKDQSIIPGRRRAGGMLAFDFTVTVRKDQDGTPVFTGPSATQAQTSGGSNPSAK